MYLFFFFKQKTAYELRISDWSSDVCSSDLEEPERLEEQRNHDTERGQDGHHGAGDHQAVEDALDTVTGAELRPHLALRDCESKQAGRGAASDHGPAGEVAPGAQPPCRGDQLRVRFAEPLATRDAADLAERSEEHTSELQSLMRNTY